MGIAPLFPARVAVGVAWDTVCQCFWYHGRDFRMNYSSFDTFDPQEANKKIIIGTITIYLILLVSLGATLAYWFVLSGAGEAQQASFFWQSILWLLVLTGFVAELIKKVTLSTFRHGGIWLTATIISIFTVMGTYTLLDATRQDTLNKTSDQYQDSRQQKTQALQNSQPYAWAKGFDLATLEKEKAVLVIQREQRKITYADYLNQKKSVEEKINAKRAYEASLNSAELAQTTMQNTQGGLNSNPLLTNIATVLETKEALIKILFYLLVSLLLEITAYWLGGQVAQQKQLKKMTEAELLDMKNKAVFGLSVKELQEALFYRVNQALLDRQEAEQEIKRLRQERTDKTEQTPLPTPTVARETQQLRQQTQAQLAQAKELHTPEKRGTASAPLSDLSLSYVPKQAQGQGVPLFTLPPEKSLINQQGHRGHKADFVPKKAQSTVPKQAQKRGTITPDTGTTGTNSQRYQALKKAIETGAIKPTIRGIQRFKYGDQGMGRSTAEKYKQALEGEGIIQ